MIRVVAGGRLPREIALAVMVQIVAEAFAVVGAEAIITSGVEGTHSRGSEHYVGHALDWRTRHLDPATAKSVRDDIAMRLGPDFDVILETAPPHLHVEWDPK
jgi:hypothetical protein